MRKNNLIEIIIILVLEIKYNVISEKYIEREIVHADIPTLIHDYILNY